MVHLIKVMFSSLPSAVGYTPEKAANESVTHALEQFKGNIVNGLNPGVMS